MSAPNWQRLYLDGEQTGPGSSVSTSSSSAMEIDPEINRNSLLILDDECLYRIFESLQLSELGRLKIMCKRLYDLTGRYYETEYAKSQYFSFTIEKGRCRIQSRSEFNCKHFKLIKLDELDDNNLRIVASHYETKRLKHIAFNKMEISAETNEAYLKRILANVEILQFEKCWFKNDVGVSFLRHCLNLKCLALDDYAIKSSLIDLSDVKHQWMMEKYPKLEFLSYNVSNPSNNMWPMIRSFFVENPNVELFYPSSESASMPIDEIIYRINLNNVRVKGLCLKLEQMSFIEIDHIYGVLNVLHAQNYFTDLHLIITREATLTDRNCAKTLALLEGIYGLYVTFTLTDLAVIHYISKMTNLKSLLIFIHKPGYALYLSKKLINLEEVFIRCEESNFRMMKSFVGVSSKLRRMYVFGIRSASHAVHCVQKLNNLRKRLSGACKVTIYVATDIYIDFKHINNNLNMDLVEIKMHDFSTMKNVIARFHIMNTL